MCAALAASALGQVPVFLNNFLAGAQMIKAGKLRALAVTSRNRSKAAPEVQLPH